MTGERLRGRRVVVTGGSTGIGAAIAEAAVAAGADVAVIARRREPLDRLAARIGARPIEGDVADLDGAAGAIERAAGELGGIDALVNNAGMMDLGGVAGADPVRWKRMIDLNVTGLIACTAAALPCLSASAAADLVNIGSLAGVRAPNAANGVYAATKHAVSALTESWRLELAQHGIRVSLVAPGLVRTGIAANVGDAESAESVRSAQERIGLRPEAVGALVVDVIAGDRDLVTHALVIASAQQGLWGVGQA